MSWWDWLLGGGTILASGVPKQVYDWVISGLSWLWAWVSSAITQIWATITTIWNSIRNLWSQISAFVMTLLVSIENWVKSLVQSVVSWVTGWIAQLWGYVTGFFTWIGTQLTNLWNYIYGIAATIIRWVNDNVIVPLTSAINNIRAFFTQWIVRIWMYIQHPELLVNLIAGALLALWQQYIQQFGGMVVRWILQKSLQQAGFFYDVIETILASIL